MGVWTYYIAIVCWFLDKKSQTYI